MRSDISVIAWDFDGVLNRNIVGGRFVWADKLEDDLGIALDAFERGVFDASFADVISGKQDIKCHLQDWLDRSGYHALDAGAVLDYWFAKDDLKDPFTCGLLQRLTAQGVVQVIATNNEERRANYIEHQAGFGSLVRQVFSSGRIKSAKPDPSFFAHVSNALMVAPSEILLIDDSATNVRTAKALGWKGFHFTDDTRAELVSFLGL
jgi:putative hydrolase of the HAD superfamily